MSILRTSGFARLICMALGQIGMPNVQHFHFAWSLHEPGDIDDFDIGLCLEILSLQGWDRLKTFNFCPQMTLMAASVRSESRCVSTSSSQAISVRT